MGPRPGCSSWSVLLPSSAHPRRERGGSQGKGRQWDLPQILDLPTLAVQHWANHSPSLSFCFLIYKTQLKISNWQGCFE